MKTQSTNRKTYKNHFIQNVILTKVCEIILLLLYKSYDSRVTGLRQDQNATSTTSNNTTTTDGIHSRALQPTEENTSAQQKGQNVVRSSSIPPLRKPRTPGHRAIQSATFEDELRRIIASHPAAFLEEDPAADFKVQTINGSIAPVLKQVLLRFFIGGKIFEATFTILATLGKILIGISFFKEYSVTRDLATILSISQPSHPVQSRTRSV